MEKALSETYKVLGSMLALETFDVDSLAALSGVKEATVRTVMGRHSDLWEQIGQEKTGKPGGQPKQYRLKSEKVSSLREGLEKLFADISHVLYAKSTISAKGEITAPLSLNLIAAEDIIKRLYRNAKTIEEKENLLKAAGASIDAAEAELGMSAQKPALEHEPIKARLAQLHSLLAAVRSSMELERALGSESWAAMGKPLEKSLIDAWPRANALFRKELDVFLGPAKGKSEVKYPGERTFIWLIDGIEQEPDLLTRKVNKAFTETLGSERVLLAEVKKLATGFVGAGEMQKHIPLACVITLDSKNEEAAMSSFEDALKSCKRYTVPSTEVIVFDAHSSQKCRERTLREGAIYLGDSVKISSEALSAFIERRGELQEAPAIPVSGKVRLHE